MPRLLQTKNATPIPIDRHDRLQGKDLCIRPLLLPSGPLPFGLRLGGAATEIRPRYFYRQCLSPHQRPRHGTFTEELIGAFGDGCGGGMKGKQNPGRGWPVGLRAPWLKGRPGASGLDEAA